MGVDLYLLNKRKTALVIDGKKTRIGTASRLCKLTEINEWRMATITATEAALAGQKMPKTVIIDIEYDMPMALSRETLNARPVLRWADDRTRVTDFEWDDLPVLGYAIRDNESHAYTLYEKRFGKLYPVSVDRAIEVGILAT
ncbi:MAG TPA: hypothetical protein PLD79_06845 [Halothiobacillus sp.]|nr:hypothetical protein [Halothiobacillus sp.]